MTLVRTIIEGHWKRLKECSHRCHKYKRYATEKDRIEDADTENANTEKASLENVSLRISDSIDDS